MDIFLQNAIPYLLAYKYLALFVISFIAAFVVPIPSGSILMAAAAFASEGYFKLSWVIVISVIGNLLGDNIGYWTARFYGEDIFSRIGFRKILNSKTFKKIEQKFRNKPGFIVLASRFEVVSTLSVNLLSGVGRVPYNKYLTFESIGTVLQVCFYGTIGYIFGYNWQSANSIIGKIFTIIALILILILIAFWSKVIKYLRSL